MTSTQLSVGIRCVILKDCDYLKPYDWTIKGLIPTHGITVLYGQSGSGKTFITTHMALCVASGADFLKHKIKQQGRVIYIAAESPKSTQRRFAVMRDWDKVGYGGYKFKGDEVSIYEGNIDLFRNPENVIQAIRETGDFIDTKLCIIDTLSSAFAGVDENSVDMATVVNQAKYIQDLLKCAVLIVHHMGKDASAGLRGHSSLRGNVEQSIQISGFSNPRMMIVDKIKDEKVGDQTQFDLLGIEVGIDDEGEPMHGCLVQAASFDAKPRQTNSSGLTANGQIALNVFNKLTAETRDIEVDQDSFKRNLVSAFSHCEEKHRSTYAVRAITHLIAKNKIKRNENDAFIYA